MVPPASPGAYPSPAVAWAPNVAYAPPPGTPSRTRTIATASGESPLWYLLTSVALVVVAAALVFGAAGAGLFDEGAETEGSALLVAALLAIAASGLVSFLWIRRLGVNSGLFGGWLVFAASIPWERFGFVGGTTTSITVLQMRVVVALLLGLASILLFRRRLIVLVWRAGRLGAPFVADLIWIFNLVGWALITFPLAHSIFNPIERRTALYVTYEFDEPSLVPIVTGLILSGIAGLMWIVTLLTVTIVQHRDIRQARRLLAATG